MCWIIILVIIDVFVEKCIDYVIYFIDKGEVKLTQIEPALQYCTDLIYGYSGISSIDYKIISLNPNLDHEEHVDYYNRVTKLKKKFPNLNVYLSVGGGADLDKPEKYLTLVCYYFLFYICINKSIF